MKTKPDYWYKQSAVIPFLIRNGKIKIILITTLKKKHWIIPKGIMEENLTPQESAAKEAVEEAGIEGRVLPGCVGHYQYKKWGGTCRVDVYLMKVEKILEDWPEVSLRDRRILGTSKALSLVKEKALKKILGNIIEIIKTSEFLSRDKKRRNSRKGTLKSNG